MVIDRIKTGRRPVSHPVSTRRQVVLRDQLDGWLRGPLSDPGRQPDRHAAAGARIPPTWCGARERTNRPRASRAGWRGSSSPRPIPTACMQSASPSPTSCALVETINVAMTPRQPLGMTPSALALSPDGKRLYVVCSDANAVAVVDVSEERSDVAGVHPDWLVSDRRARAGRRPARGAERPRLAIVIRIRKDRIPRKPAEPVHLGVKAVEYVGRIQTGTASFIDPITDQRLREYSKTVLANSPYRDARLDDAGTGGEARFPIIRARRHRSSTSSTSSRKTAPTIRCSAT